MNKVWRGDGGTSVIFGQIDGAKIMVKWGELALTGELQAGYNFASIKSGGFCSDGRDGRRKN